MRRRGPRRTSRPVVAVLTEDEIRQARDGLARILAAIDAGTLDAGEGTRRRLAAAIEALDTVIED
jgi:hypothetical protein